MMVWFSAWQKAGSEGWHPIWHTGTKQKQNRTRGGLFFAPFLGILFLTNIGYPFIMVEVTKGETDVSTWNRERHAGADRIKASGG